MWHLGRSDAACHESTAPITREIALDRGELRSSISRSGSSTTMVRARSLPARAGRPRDVRRAKWSRRALPSNSEAVLGPNSCGTGRSPMRSPEYRKRVVRQDRGSLPELARSAHAQRELICLAQDRTRRRPGPLADAQTSTTELAVVAASVWFAATVALFPHERAASPFDAVGSVWTNSRKKKVSCGWSSRSTDATA